MKPRGDECDREKDGVRGKGAQMEEGKRAKQPEKKNQAAEEDKKNPRRMREEKEPIEEEKVPVMSKFADPKSKLPPKDSEQKK